MDGRKRYGNNKCGRESFWKRNKTASFSFENGVVWTASNSPSLLRRQLQLVFLATNTSSEAVATKFTQFDSIYHHSACPTQFPDRRYCSELPAEEAIIVLIVSLKKFHLCIDIDGARGTLGTKLLCSQACTEVQEGDLTHWLDCSWTVVGTNMWRISSFHFCILTWKWRMILQGNG